MPVVNTHAEVILAPTMAAVESPDHRKFYVSRDLTPVRLSAPGLVSSEEIDIFQSVDGGTTWVTYKSAAGAALVFTATIQDVTIDAPVLLGFLKDASTAAVGIFAFKGL